MEEGLPTEFRLFRAGWNETENGRFLFDDKAARSVMSAWKDWGVDLAIDLEHQMLDDSGSDPTARDARGWCKLEVRNGELWACDVKWTPDGAARLEQKRQRYVSPAFDCDPETKRVVKMHNIAITAMPATHKTPALVAASIRRLKTMGLDPSLVKQALEAVKGKDGNSALEILEGLLASAAGAEPEPDGDEDGAEGDGADGVAPPEEESEKVIDPKVVDASADGPKGDGDEEDDDDGDGDGDGDGKDGKKKKMSKALHAMLRRETGTNTFAEAVAKVQEYRASHLALEGERQKLAKERAVLESAERRKLCIELVTLGAEFPATIWADDKAMKLKPRWLGMKIETLREHAAEQRKARGAKKVPTQKISPPGGSDGESEVAGLTPQQLAICKETGCDPKTFVALSALQSGKKVG